MGAASPKIKSRWTHASYKSKCFSTQLSNNRTSESNRLTFDGFSRKNLREKACLQHGDLAGELVSLGNLLGGKATALMTLQALIQLTFRDFLNLAQEFVRNIADFVATAQFVFQMGHKAGRHFRVG